MLQTNKLFAPQECSPKFQNDFSSFCFALPNVSMYSIYIATKK